MKDKIIEILKAAMPPEEDVAEKFTGNNIVDAIEYGEKKQRWRERMVYERLINEINSLYSGGVSENICKKCEFWTDGCFKDTDSADCFQYSMFKPKHPTPEISEGDIDRLALKQFPKVGNPAVNSDVWKPQRNIWKKGFKAAITKGAKPISEDRMGDAWNECKDVCNSLNISKDSFYESLKKLNKQQKL